jgi:hypothetical protein
MTPALSFLAIIFIGVFIYLGEGHPYDPIFKSDSIRQYNQTTAKMPSIHNTNITCNACKKRTNNTKNIRRVLIDPVTVVPVLQDVPKPPAPSQAQKKVQPQPQVEKVQKPETRPQVEEPMQPTRYLRNGYYAQPILKTYLRGSPLVKNLAAYNPPDRYCYSIMHSIKSIVGI